MLSSADRRRRQRIRVHLPVRLFRPPAGPYVPSTTENLSSEGLYCIVKEPFRRGERLQCEIAIPESLGAAEGPTRLQCHVIVKRVESLRHVRALGLGCHIENYSLAPGPLQPEL